MSASSPKQQVVEATVIAEQGNRVAKVRLPSGCLVQQGV